MTEQADIDAEFLREIHELPKILQGNFSSHAESPGQMPGAVFYYRRAARPLAAEKAHGMSRGFSLSLRAFEEGVAIRRQNGSGWSHFVFWSISK